MAISNTKFIIIALFAMFPFLFSQLAQALPAPPKPHVNNIKYPIAKVVARKVRSGHGYYESFSSIDEVSEYQLIGSLSFYFYT
ncbi:hypothetical protein [Methylocucumis oryzae]|uniref:Uncharacterized protein n=1 Tax=Methylocucumis oryzae TaxID=1632867 RepID=A0A0F3IN77_9GAMM|nr:hypothetical protein [Methylocucumis oryzae]KJV08013.1 hypothetical protein VZ94_00940 [Methylocucumis oryzae]